MTYIELIKDRIEMLKLKIDLDLYILPKELSPRTKKDDLKELKQLENYLKDWSKDNALK